MIPWVTRYGALDTQVCLPSDWTDDQIVEFTNAANPSGTVAGWVIRRAGDPSLVGHPECISCGLDSRFIHVMLDA